MEFTQECSMCGSTFDKENPCCCDDGVTDTNNGVSMHKDGICKNCCKHEKQFPASWLRSDC